MDGSGTDFFVLAQIFGGIAAVLMAVSFQLKKTSQLCVLQATASALFAVQYFLLGAVSGYVLNLIALLRCLIFAGNKPWTHSKWVMLTLNGITVLASVAVMLFTGSYLHWSEYITIVPVLLVTYRVWQRKAAPIRWVQIYLSCPLWFLYNFLAGSYFGMITDSVNFASSAWFLLRQRRAARSRQVARSQPTGS